MVCLLCSETESWVQQYCLSGTALLQGAAGTSTGTRRGGSADRARRGAAQAQGRRSRGGAGAAGRPGTSEVGAGRRPGQSVEAAAEDEAPARRGMRGRPRGSGAAGAGVASGPPATRRRRSARGGREDDEACGTAGQEEDATCGRSRGARAVGDQRAAGDGGGGGAGGRAREQGHTRPNDVDLKLVRCRREGRGIVGRGGKVSAGWPYQPALTCSREVRLDRLVPAGGN